MASAQAPRELTLGERDRSVRLADYGGGVMAVVFGQHEADYVSVRIFFHTKLYIGGAPPTEVMLSSVGVSEAPENVATGLDIPAREGMDLSSIDHTEVRWMKTLERASAKRKP